MAQNEYTSIFECRNVIYYANAQRTIEETVLNLEYYTVVWRIFR